MPKPKNSIMNTMMGGFGRLGQSVGDRVRGNPETTMISLTAAGSAKARAHAIDGKRGDVLCYIQRAQLASMREISQATSIELRTTQNIVHELADSKPPLAVIGGQGG